MDIELRHCRALIALAEQQGIARAAKALGVAQSTLSEALFSLERVVGFAITERTPGSGATLTRQASALLPHARRLLQVADETMAFARGLQPQRSFAIGASESVGTYVLPDVLERLRETWPALIVQVRTGLCAELRQLVSAGRLQAAITIGPSIDQAVPPDQTLLQLTRSRLALFRAPGTTEPALVPGLPAPAICVPDPEGALNALLSTWLRHLGVPATLHSAGSVEAVKRRVASGGELGALPRYAVDAELAQGELVEVATSQPLPAMMLEVTALDGAAIEEPLAGLLDELRRIRL
ncbi:hypothetical protein ATSB10_14510 [Dyella thiooxydans]|uniref:HTH lysR-type domain-containing protein n=1 Tax=Dyella thiooxydans TaxID=445710 RepID=A0A161JD13_9GAMM|nr:LysR family transcriptional regulator [Dyella thiooxydans]AND68905.1 hypothetical protein ATSB10_14510 [Dyella thiooxydans]